MRVREDRVAWRTAGEEVIMLDLARSEYVSLNRTAAVVWTAVVSGEERDTIVARLCERFRVEPDRAGADVDRLIAEWRSGGLLDEESGDAPAVE